MMLYQNVKYKVHKQTNIVIQDKPVMAGQIQAVDKTQEEVLVKKAHIQLQMELYMGFFAYFFFVVQDYS
jgi:hypothetical protein